MTKGLVMGHADAWSYVRHGCGPSPRGAQAATTATAKPHSKQDMWREEKA